MKNELNRSQDFLSKAVFVPLINFADEWYLALRLLCTYGVLDITSCHDTQRVLKYFNTKLDCFKLILPNKSCKRYLIKKTKDINLKSFGYKNHTIYTKKYMSSVYKQCNLILKNSVTVNHKTGTAPVLKKPLKDLRKRDNLERKQCSLAGNNIIPTGTSVSYNYLRDSFVAITPITTIMQNRWVRGGISFCGERNMIWDMKNACSSVMTLCQFQPRDKLEKVSFEMMTNTCKIKFSYSSKSEEKEYIKRNLDHLETLVFSHYENGRWYIRDNKRLGKDYYKYLTNEKHMGWRKRMEKALKYVQCFFMCSKKDTKSGFYTVGEIYRDIMCRIQLRTIHYTNKKDVCVRFIGCDGIQCGISKKDFVKECIIKACKDVLGIALNLHTEESGNVYDYMEYVADKNNRINKFRKAA